MRGTDLLKDKNWTLNLDTLQAEVHLLHKVLLKILPEVLFMSNQNLKTSRDHHNPPEGFDYPVVSAPGGRLQCYYKVWEQNECHPRVALILKHGYRIILAQPIELSHSHNSQRLYKSTKTNISVGMCTGNASEKCCYSGKNECKPGLLQQIASNSKTRQKNGGQ